MNFPFLRDRRAITGQCSLWRTERGYCIHTIERRKKTVKKKKSQRGRQWQRKKEKKLYYLWQGHNVNLQHQSDNSGFTEREFKLQYLLIRENSACAKGLQEPTQHVAHSCKGRCREGIKAGKVSDQLLPETCKGCWTFTRSGEGAAAGRKSNGKPLDPGNTSFLCNSESPWDLGVLLIVKILRVIFSLQRKAARGKS